MAQLDPFLNLWDERYHALVAKNLISDPLKPALYNNPILGYDFKDWTRNHIWLHKQPLFLYHIALFFKVFGVNEFVLRLPTAIMTTLISYFIFRIGKLTINSKAGFYGALLFAVAYYCLEYCSGLKGMDHNDAAFIFYVSASIWAWTENEEKPAFKWLLAIGLFAGCAVLVKWLTGLLVFSGWGLAIIFNAEKRKQLKSYAALLISFIICLVVFLPWQLYISHRFPEESAHEYAYNTKHVFEIIEGHGGTEWFYLQDSPTLYGFLLSLLIPLGLFCLFVQLKNNTFKIAFFTYIVLIYGFFSLLVQTKMSNYVYVVSPIIFLGLGSMISFLEKIPNKSTSGILPIIPVSTLFLLAFFTLNLQGIRENHFTLGPYGSSGYRDFRLINVSIYKSLPDMFWGERAIIFNVKRSEHIDVLFHTDLIGYDKIPLREEVELLKNKGWKLGIFDDGNLPDYLKNDGSIFKISERLY